MFVRIRRNRARSSVSSTWHRQHSLILWMCALLFVSFLCRVHALDTKNKVTSLPTFGRVREEQYAGYVEVDPAHGSHMWYWFFESRSKPTSDPLVIWMTGGPGCSGSLAQFFENGPYSMDTLSKRIQFNKYSWNSNANLVFIDQPVPTGFSYTEDTHLVREDHEAADDFYNFLQKFFVLFPEFKDRKVFLAGESFGGHYVPAFGSRILLGNRLNQGNHINLAGIAVGNGYTSPADQVPEFPMFALKNKLINQNTFESLTSIAAECRKTITEKSSSSSQTLNICDSVFRTIVDSSPSINFYDIRKPCVGGDLCYDFSSIQDYLNRDDVLKALHVSSNSNKWTPCTFMLNYRWKASDRIQSFSPQYAELLNSNIPVILYHGTKDLICNWRGGRALSRNIEWMFRSSFQSTPSIPMKVGQRVVGSVTSSQGLTFLTVRSAGHMVPHDQPYISTLILNRLLSGSLSNRATFNPDLLANNAPAQESKVDVAALARLLHISPSSSE